MGTLFGFIVGYVVGAKAGNERFEEVMDAFRSLRESDEVRSFVQVVRGHARDTARDLGDRLDTALASEGGMPSEDDLMAEARARLQVD